MELLLFGLEKLNTRQSSDLLDVMEDRYRRIRLACSNEGVLLNGKTVRKLMKELGINSLIRVKKYRSYRGSEGRACYNILKRQFDAKRPNEKWVTDVTEFKVNGRELYLSPIMELYNGEIIAYNLDARPLPSMVNTMLTDALKLLAKEERLIWHSDRKRTPRAVLTGMCYSAGGVMRQGSSSLTRLTGQSAMTSST